MAATKSTEGLVQEMLDTVRARLRELGLEPQPHALDVLCRARAQYLVRKNPPERNLLQRRARSRYSTAPRNNPRSCRPLLGRQHQFPKNPRCHQILDRFWRIGQRIRLAYHRF